MRRRYLILVLALALGSAVLAMAAPVSAGPAPGRAHPGGGRIVWTQVLDSKFSRAALVSSRPDGRGVRRLTHPGAHGFDLNAAVSPGGRRVAFERDRADGSARILVVGRNGRGEHVVRLRCHKPCAALVDPGWTPNGRRIVFTRVVGPFDQVNNSARSAVLWSARLDGTGVRRLSEPGIDGTLEDYHPRFAPAGYLTFVRVRNADTRPAVFRMQHDGSGVRRLTPWRLGADVPDVSPALGGPTKDLVVFETYGNGPPKGKQQDVATVPATCSPVAECVHEMRNLTHNGAGPRISNNPAWSPDGSRIAFTDVRPRKNHPLADIWTMLPDGHDRHRVSHSPRFEFRPDWG